MKDQYKNLKRIALLAALATAVCELGAATTSYLYVVSAGERVRRYAVDEKGGITLDKQNFILADSLAVNKTSDMMIRPIKIVRIGRVFYVLDAIADSNPGPGVFSIAKYDLCGNFLGKLVHRGPCAVNNTPCMMDGMAASPDGKWLYLNDFKAGAIVRVSVETGAYATFATGMSGNRDIHVASDGKIYSAARGNKKIYVFNPDGTAASPAYYSYDDQVGGVYVDEAAGKVFGRYVGYMQVHNLGTDKVVETVSMPGQGLAIEKVGDKLVSGNWSIWNPKSILFTCDPADSYAITQIASGLGNVQDVYLDPNGVDEKPDVSQAHTSLIAHDNALYFAADNGASAVGATASSTFWKSTDGGVSWNLLTSADVANPTFVAMKTGGLMLLSEPRRGTSDLQTFNLAAFAADGTRTLVCTATNKTGNVFIPANGHITSSAWGFAGQRVGLGLKTSCANTMALFSFVGETNSAAFPDNVFTINVTTNTWTSALVRRPWSDVLPPVVFKDAAGNHCELAPIVQTRTAVATRVGPECAMVTENKNGTEVVPKWAPVKTDYISLPGSSKAFDIVYDEASQCYWAVTVPATNVDDFVTYDPGDIRNTLALYASTNLYNWCLCSILRNEGTFETVTFANPQLAIVGDDMVVTYSTCGTENAGQTVIGVNHVSCRVPNFRALRPTPAAVDPIVLFATDFNLGNLKLCRLDLQSRTLTSSTFIKNGSYDTHSLNYLSGVVAIRNRIYINSETQGVFMFDLKGRYKRFYAVPSGTKCDAMCATPDGGSLLVTDCSYINDTWDHNTIRRLDLTTGTWTTLVATATDSTFRNPRGICAKSDGSFFVASRDSNYVRHYAADGSTYALVGNFPGALSVALDEDETHLFVGTRYGWVMKVDLSDNSYVTLAGPVSDVDGAAHAIAPRNGRLWVCDFGAGCIYTLDPDTPYQTPRMELSGFDATGRSAWVDLSFKIGMAIFYR